MSLLAPRLETRGDTPQSELHPEQSMFRQRQPPLKKEKFARADNQTHMSIKSKQRNEKRPKPNYSKDLPPRPYKYYIRQRPPVSFEIPAVETKGAFGKARVSRKPPVPETVPALDLTTETV